MPSKADISRIGGQVGSGHQAGLSVNPPPQRMPVVTHHAGG